MITPVVPSDNLIVILTHNARCIVARYRQVGPYTYDLVRAANWQALEDEACAAVQALIGAITDSDVYPCPEDIAQRAVWGDANR